MRPARSIGSAGPASTRVQCSEHCWIQTAAASSQTRPSVSSRPSRTYIPNTNIVRATFTTPRGVFEVVDFAPRFRQYERHFRPNLLLRRVRRLSGEPHARIRCRPTYDYGRVTPEVRRRSNHLSYAIRGQQLRLGRPWALSERGSSLRSRAQTPHLPGHGRRDRSHDDKHPGVARFRPKSTRRLPSAPRPVKSAIPDEPGLAIRVRSRSLPREPFGRRARERVA